MLIKRFESSIKQNLQLNRVFIIEQKKMSVKVGVRVRPFNKRQQQLDCRRCVEMQDKTTRLIDADGSVKNFVYDYSFWSHDKFMVDPDGIYIPVDDKYADQQRVYRQIGSDILINAWQGYNCCLFAYGQTGSGKSYSMIGYGANRGIIPIVCDEIFKKINNSTDKSKAFEVGISMMEIYNETVRDLLQKNKKKQLKICQSKKLGVYVEGLYKHPVYSYEEIAKKIQEGSNNRSIAATLMNESSSRSHTIVSINFVQRIQQSMSQTSIKYSCIHLVDLAGSQCVAKTGVDSKDRLRQTAKINQSLSTLGRVIEILADNASKIQKQFVPYRDSKLTFILRNALGGNSRTAMICAISPADDNFEQTLSTLRYASRAKKIQNKAIINQSDVDKLIRMLREENEYLKKMLQQAKFTKTVINQEVISNYNRMSQNMAELGIECGTDDLLLEQIQEQSNKSRTTQQTYEEEESIIEQQTKLIQNTNHNLSLPYITNVSQDQLLSFRVKYNCEDLMIGNKQGNPKPDVILAALGIQPNHARIYIDGEEEGVKKVFLEVLSEEAEDYTYVNGQNVSCKEKKELFDNDRLIFGTGCIFLVVIFGGKQRTQTLIKIEEIDYQFAIKEMQNINLDRSRVIIGQGEEQLRKKIVLEVEKEYEDIKKSNQQNMKKQIEQQELEYQEKIKEIESKKNAETERLKEELERKHNQAKKLEQQKNRVREEIQKYREMQKQMQLRMLEKIELQKQKQEQQKLLETTNKQKLEQERKREEEQRKKQKQAEEELQRTNKILMDKLLHISTLQSQIHEINLQNQQKQQQIKQQLQKQQQLVQKQLQVKTIMCQNENIITEYRLELVKKTKNAKELRELLVKKQKAFLQKQLIELVPMVQKFNLMGKEMNRRIEAGLSIEYKYISESQIIQALKNNTYKSKLKILVHVINKEQNRGYYWTTQVFKNRFEHAIDSFEQFISKNYQRERLTLVNKDKSTDPYWQPQSFEVFSFGYLSLECLLYQFSFRGNVSLVNLGHKIGEMEVTLTPLISQAGNLVKVTQSNDQIKIFNPRDHIERSISFELQIKNVEIHSTLQIIKLKIQYELLESNYKVRKYQTQDIHFSEVSKFHYTKHHTISQISQNTILHYTDRPVAFIVSAIIRLTDDDQLTNRESFLSSKVSSFAISKGSFANLNSEESANQDFIFKNVEEINVTSFTEVPRPQLNKKPSISQPIEQRTPNMTKKTGTIVQNVQIMSKIQNDYQKKKRQSIEYQQKNQSNHQQSHKQSHDDKKKKKKDENCSIY